MPRSILLWVASNGLNTPMVVAVGERVDMENVGVSSGSHQAAIDREERRVAQLLYGMSIVPAALGSIYLLLAWLVPSWKLRLDWLLVGAILAHALPILFLKRGYVRVAKWLVLTLSWGAILALCITNGGLLAPAMPLHLLTCVAVALLTSGWQFVLGVAIAILSVLVLGYLGHTGALPTLSSSIGHIPRAASLLIALGWLMLMLRLALLQLRQALFRAEEENIARKQTEATLRQAEAELRALNEKLEARVGERTAELLAAKEAALSASHEKSTFLATMSHELRTPVAGIVGLVELLGRCELPNEARSMIEPLLSSSKTLLSLIGDVLDYSKIEAGKLEIERIPMRVRAILRDVILLLRPKAEAQGLKLELVIEDAVPNFILCDPTRLQQIVLNLAGNALKFTPSGSVRVRVWYRDEVLSLSVQDTGIGISQEAQAQLFSAFVQADPSTSRKYSGSGLGLMITKRLAQRMGGDVTVESELGVGSTFTCTIKAPAAARPRTEPESLPDRQRPLRILLAEDNDINAFILTKLLLHLGHTCDRVTDGKQAIEQATQKTYEAIFMDMHMPVLDGIEATRQIRALPGPQAQLPIIGLSADAIAEHEAEYMAAGLTAYLTKPCTLAQLKQVLAQKTAKVAT